MKSYNRQSSESDYLKLVTVVYQDAVAKCSADVSDLRDLMTIKSRVKNEGLSFLTITLPQFAKDFERSLADGRISSTLFRGFPRTGSRRKRGAIPAFLQGMLRRIFNQETGELLDENPQSNGGAASAHSTLVDSVRQICRLVAKVELECTEERTRAALDSFIEVEQGLEQFSPRNEDVDSFLHLSRVLWTGMVVKFDLNACRPKHGPGATAERIMGNQKFVWRRWYDRLEPYFPLLGNAYPLSLSADLRVGEEGQGFVESVEVLENVTVVQEHDEDPVRVCLVPKTLKAPRVIAIEPVCMQYAQQGIRDELYKALERYRLTAGHVNFRDQSINQQRAITSSVSGLEATLDLSDASDRVPATLALSMFDSNPSLKEAIQACRSTNALLPDGRMVSGLRKFASMGSALCFPVEAMYFFTITVKALLDLKGLSYTFRNAFIVSRDVYVYGDDIIVPVYAAEAVCEALQKYNCKVNVHKSFWTGRFRESCGVDAYAGKVVTPIYLRHARPQSRRQSSQLISWTATAHLFLEKGYVRTAQFMLQQCERVVGKLPHLSETSPGLSRGPLGYRAHWWREGPHRWHEKYQRYEVKALVPSPVYRDDILEGYAALSKCLSQLEGRIHGPADPPKEARFLSPLKSGRDQSLLRHDVRSCKRPYCYDCARVKMFPVSAVDRQHLVRTALHGAVTLKRRWVPV